MTVCKRVLPVGEEEALVNNRTERPLLGLEHGTDLNILKQAITWDGTEPCKLEQNLACKGTYDDMLMNGHKHAKEQIMT